VRTDPACALFVGLATVDTVYRVEELPAANAKVVAVGQELAAGGPAANAAVAFAGLGGRASLITALGRHVLARYSAAELGERGVEVIDALPETEVPPAVSSIYVVDATGDRSVVSVNTRGLDPAPPGGLTTAVAGAGVVLLDGHYPELALAAARLGRAAGKPVVLDGGSWKPVLDELLPLVDIVVCSADFRAPGTGTVAESAAALRERGVPQVAATRGGAPVLWWAKDGEGEVAVRPVTVRDTLGAGDVFHGAFAYALAARPEGAFPDALAFAATVATLRCQSPGPRAWLADAALPALAASLDTGDRR
jgi:sugar/nucleoside kinase (ribokinase family)